MVSGQRRSRGGTAWKVGDSAASRRPDTHTKPFQARTQHWGLQSTYLTPLFYGLGDQGPERGLTPGAELLTPQEWGANSPPLCCLGLGRLAQLESSRSPGRTLLSQRRVLQGILLVCRVDLHQSGGGKQRALGDSRQRRRELPRAMGKKEKSKAIAEKARPELAPEAWPALSPLYPRQSGTNSGTLGFRFRVVGRGKRRLSPFLSQLVPLT